MVLDYGIKDLTHTPLWSLIQEKLKGDLEWKTAKVSSEENPSESQISDIRKSRIAWVEDLYLRKQLFHSINLYNKQQWNYNIDGLDALQYGIYPVGGKYGWHRDDEVNITILNDQKLTRKLSMTIWLSDPDEYEGGELDIEIEGPRVRADKRYETLKLSKGSIIIFRSCLWHRVRPVTSGVRKSLVTWFRGPPFR